METEFVDRQELMERASLKIQKREEIIDRAKTSWIERARCWARSLDEHGGDSCNWDQKSVEGLQRTIKSFKSAGCCNWHWVAKQKQKTTHTNKNNSRNNPKEAKLSCVKHFKRHLSYWYWYFTISGKIHFKCNRNLKVILCTAKLKDKIEFV